MAAPRSCTAGAWQRSSKSRPRSRSPGSRTMARRFRPRAIAGGALVGNRGGFAIVVLSTDGLSGDRAPDNGSWTYAVTPLTLRMRLLSHGVAHAGRPFRSEE